MNKKFPITNLGLFLIIVFCLFLPFSSWLVSYTGKPSLSLVRDFVVILLFLLGAVNFLFQKKKKNNGIILICLGFVVLGLISFFWSEASPMQWLRGFRFTFVPILFLTALSLLDFSKQQRKNIYRSIIISSIFVLVLAGLEFFKIKIPLTSDLSSEGSLNTIHGVGGEFRRLQSVLAGPNAFGLYLLSIIALIIGAGSYFGRKIYLLIPFCLIAIILTLSRSSLIGLIVFALVASFFYAKKVFGSAKTLSWLASALLLISMIFWFGYKSDSFNGLVTHGASSTERVLQYKRVWDQRHEIGFLGRGMGTAGPSSQNRLDNGSNHWTENIYLDMFEELGLAGLIIFLLLLIVLAIKLNKNNSVEARIAFSLLLGYMTAGLFINIYTGQVGLYFLLLMCGLAINGRKENVTDFN